jgi:hypothetical protein
MVAARDGMPMAIPIISPRDNSLSFELDGLFVGFEEGNGIVFDTGVIDGEVVIDIIDDERIIDVADIAASGFPH